jgi:DNA-binding response OmpR family regulator
MATRSDTSRIEATVLVVDDDDDFRAALAETLEEEGCDVLDARTGEAALALLDDAAKGRARAPDLLVLDLLMPRMSGIEVLQRLRKSRRWASLPVLVVTAVNDQMLPVRLGVPIVFKPDVQVVLDAVRQQLARRRAPTSPATAAEDGSGSE